MHQEAAARTGGRRRRVVDAWAARNLAAPLTRRLVIDHMRVCGSRCRCGARA